MLYLFRNKTFYQNSDTKKKSICVHHVFKSQEHKAYSLFFKAASNTCLTNLLSTASTLRFSHTFYALALVANKAACILQSLESNLPYLLQPPNLTSGCNFVSFKKTMKNGRAVRRRYIHVNQEICRRALEQTVPTKSQRNSANTTCVLEPYGFRLLSNSSSNANVKYYRTVLPEPYLHAIFAQALLNYSLQFKMNCT